MSRENVELVLAAFEAFNRDGIEAALKVAAPDFEFDQSRAMGPYRGVYRLGEVKAMSDEFWGTWASFRLEPDEAIDAGEHVVTPFTNTAMGRDGIEVRARGVWVWTIRDGALARLCLYQERAEALEAVGLSASPERRGPG